MHNFENAVPFDPGYSPISFSFVGNALGLIQEFSKLKAPHQKKFWLMKNEAQILNLINKTTSFYLGCILWGGFLSNRFKNSPKEIENNNASKMSEEEFNDFDCTYEVKFTLDYIKNWNRDFKYFVGKPTKIEPFITEILTNYLEFAKINANFRNTKITSDIKTPECIAHFKEFSTEKLDELCDKIYDCINSKKIEKLLDIKFYN